MSETEEELRKVREERARRRAIECEEAVRRRDAAQREFEQLRERVGRLEERRVEVVHDKERADTAWSSATESVGDRRSAVAVAKQRALDARRAHVEAELAHQQAVTDNEYAKQNPGVIGWDMVSTTDRRTEAQQKVQEAASAIGPIDDELAERERELADLERTVDRLVTDRERARDQLGLVEADLSEARRSLAQSESEYAQARAAVDQACD